MSSVEELREALRLEREAIATILDEVLDEAGEVCMPDVRDRYARAFLAAPPDRTARYRLAQLVRSEIVRRRDAGELFLVEVRPCPGGQPFPRNYYARG